MGYIDSLKERMKDVHGPTFVLVAFFSISSWIDLYGVWVEFPLIISAVPESWNLPSYLAVVIQIANLGPITYTIVNRFYPNKKKEVVVIYIIISVGVLATFFLSFFWNKTVEVAGAMRSVPLLALIGALALVDCTSTVVYIPFMARFKPAYIPAYYIGEGLGGLFPALVGLIQGAGTDPECVNVTLTELNVTSGLNYTYDTVYPVYSPPLFSVGTFFGILCGMMMCSGLAFTLLNFLPSSKREMEKASYDEAVPLNDMKSAEEKNHNGKNGAVVGSEEDDDELPPLRASDRQMSRSGDIWVPKQPWKSQNGNLYRSIDDKDATTTRAESMKRGQEIPPEQQMSTCRMAFVLAITGFISFQIYGLFGAIQPFACLPYGGITYTMSIRLISLLNPVISTIALFVPLKNFKVLPVLVAIGTILHGYVLTLAFLSPNPPLAGTTEGTVLTILVTLSFDLMLVYSLITCASLLRIGAGHRGLVLMGAMVQGGAFCGTVVAFCLINVAQVFESAPTCGVH